MKSPAQTSSLESLTQAELVTSTRKAVAIETVATTNIVRHFVEIYKRRTFAILSYSSMLRFAVEELGYDKASGQRRVNAMHLAIAVPEVLTMIDEKRMCLQVAADIQTFLNKERGARRAYSDEQKARLVEQCLSKSTRHVQRLLTKLNPACDFKDTKRFVTENRLQITYTASVKVEEKLDRLKEILAHVNPYMSREELIEYIAEIALDKLDPIRKAQRIQKRAERSAKSPRSARSSRMPRPARSAPSTNPASEPLHSVVPAQEQNSTIDFRSESVGEYGEVQLVAELGKMTRGFKSFGNAIVRESSVSYESQNPISFSGTLVKRYARFERRRIQLIAAQKWMLRPSGRSTALDCR